MPKRSSNLPGEVRDESPVLDLRSEGVEKRAVARHSRGKACRPEELVAAYVELHKSRKGGDAAGKWRMDRMA